MVGICSKISVKYLPAVYLERIHHSDWRFQQYHEGVQWMCSPSSTFITENKFFFSVARNQTTWLTNHSKSNYAKACKMTQQTHFLQNQKSMLINVNRQAKLSLLFILNQHRFNFTCTHTGKLCMRKKETKKTYL